MLIDQAQHGRLLFGLAAAAEDCQSGISAHSVQERGDLGGNEFEEFVGVGRIERRQHHVLPHENAQSRAFLPEVVALVDHRPRDSNHVQSRLCQAFQDTSGAGVALKRDRVGRHPHRTTAVHPDAVDIQTESTIGSVDLHRPEAN